MDYWALGHVHLAEVVSSGSPCIVYPGSTQACTEAETGPHGCYLATIEHGITTLKWLATGTVNPRRIEVDLSGANTVEEARSAVLSAVDEAIDGEAASSIMRIALTGTRRFADSFGAESARELIALVRESVADHIPPVWVNSSIADSSRRYYGEDLSRSSNAFVTSMVEVAAKLDIETTIRSSKAVAELPAHERNAILSQLMQEPDRLREMALEAAYHQVMEGKVGR